jgi:antitoxin component YwqK of YwqJK toxin-antitoxin module
MSVELTCVQEYYANGKLKSEEFFNSEGKRHNAAGPAYREWHENGQLKHEEYWLNGKRHNDAGPAIRRWYENGQLWSEAYWINGRWLTKAEWEARVNPAPCDGKVVEIEGRKYKLVATKE